MNSKYSVFFLFILIATASPSVTQGQDTTRSLGTLTLKECIKIAEKHSPIAKSHRYDLIASKWQYREYHADLLPSLTLSGNAPNYNKDIFSNTLDNGTTVFSSRTQSNANASLSIRENLLPTGGFLSLSSGLTRLGIFNGENSYLWKSNPLQLSIHQPLFQYNNLKWRHRLEPLQYKIAKKQFAQQMENLAVRVTNRFFDVVLSKINKENAKFNVSRNDSIYQISKGRYNIGKIAENSLLQTELAYHNAQQALSKARINYNRRLNNFKILLGYPTSVKLNLKEPKDMPVISVNIEKAKRLAMQNNSQSLSYRLDKLQADQSLAQARSNGGFQATISANYGLNQTSSSFDALYKHPQNQQYVSVDFNLPIYNWGKHRAQIKSAQNEEQSATNNIIYQRRQFIQSVQYRVKNFLQLRSQALLAAQSDTIAQRRYQVAENRYRIGKISITDLFNAQNDKDLARQQYIQALRDFWTGLYNLRQLTLYNFKEDRPVRYTR